MVRLYTCLFASTGISLRDPMRSGANDDELRDLIARSLGKSGSTVTPRNVPSWPPYKTHPKKIEMYQIGG